MLEKYQLPNGMDVILAQSKKSPVVSLQAWVETGSADENKGEEGVTHFIEHLLFKGTEKYGVGEIAQRVEGAGGQLNAYTSFDQTVYYMTLSKQYLEDAMDMLSQMLGKPLFDKDEIDNEREVVIEEIKRGMDSPGRVASRAMFETVYKKHPYKKPVIGYEKIIKKISPNKIKDYYYKRYSAKNMTLLLVGDFEKKQSKKWVDSYFGDISKARPEKRKRENEDKQDKPRVKVLKTDYTDSFCYLSWPVPKVTHRDIPAIDLLSMVLGYGESSRLTKEIRNKNLVNYVGCSAYTPKNQGFITISAGLRPEQLDFYLDALLKTIRKMFEDGIGSEELLRSITAHESHEYFSMETVDGLASKIGGYHFSMKDPEYFNEYMKLLKAVDTKDLLRVFKKYFKPEKMNASLVGNHDEKETKKTLRGFQKQYERIFKELKIPKEGTKPKYKKVKFKKKAKNTEPSIHKINGYDVILMENYDVPTISLSLTAAGGLLFENSNTQGAHNLLGDIWSCGTRSMGEEEYNQFCAENAIYISGFSGRNSTGLKLNCLNNNFDLAVDTFIDTFLNPAIDEGALQREKLLSLRHLESRKDRPSEIAYIHLMKELYKDHPYSLETLGTEETLKTIDTKMLGELHNDLITKRKKVISVVGAFESKKLLELLRSKLPKTKKESYPVLALKPIPKITKSFEKSEKEQTHIFLGFKGLALDDPRKYVLDTMLSILSGQGGRLFMELRDKNSLAYTVSPMRLDGVGSGFIGTYIACSPEKLEKAEKMMLEELEKLCTSLVPEEELLRARQNLIGKFDIQLQKNSSIASKILFDEFYGLGFDTYLSHTEKVQAVTAEQIKELAIDLFRSHYIRSVVGVSEN
ncbi:MAG: M16 family metallopeptidase [Bdellovibrionales bacterium]